MVWVKSSSAREHKFVISMIVFLLTNDSNQFCYFADVKISIIVPITDNYRYLTSLKSIISQSVPESHSAELILVDEFEKNNLQKVAEKPEAKLYIAKQTSLSQKFEAGAFQATGDIFYFLMPEYLPPVDFAPRIIKACEQQSEVGTFPGSWIKRLVSFFQSHSLEKILIRICAIDNLMISKKLFKKIQGLRWDGKDRKLDFLLSNEMVSHLTNKFIQ